jgi:hypothetical protein
MNSDQFVSHQEFRNGIILQLQLAMETAMLIGSLHRALLQKRVISQSDFEAAREKVKVDPLILRVQELIAKLRGSASVEDILRDFEGPLQ